MMQPKKSELVGGVAIFWKPKVIPYARQIRSISASIRVTYDEWENMFEYDRAKARLTRQ
jgi:hypothetical protein